jgi:hypothetical protein
MQFCRVAEIPAKKLKRGRGKKELPGRIRGRILAEFWPNFTKSGRKRPEENFLKKFLISSNDKHSVLKKKVNLISIDP